MTSDCYAILGVSPSSEDVVIQAAYRALIRRYHPDANPSTEAAARVREINAAYAILRDPDRRAAYDAERAAGVPLRKGPPPMEPVEPRRRPRLSALFAGVAVLVLAGATAALTLAQRELQPPEAADRPVADRPEPVVARKPAAPSPPSSPAPPLVAESLPPAADPQVEPVRSQVAAARPAAVRPPVVAPSRSQPVRSVAAATVAPKPQPPAVRVAAATTPKPSGRRQANPSFSCSWAKSAGESAVCGSDRLATLDRQSATLFSQSMGAADAARRQRLSAIRSRFLAARNGCKSDSCVTSAYLGHMREVSEVMRSKSSDN